MAKKTKKAKKDFVPFTWEKNVSTPKKVIEDYGVTKKLNKQTSVEPTKEFVSEARKHRETLFKKK